MSRQRSDPVARFWSKVRRGSGCWEWAAGKFRDGYGQFFVAGRGSVGAHRFAYELEHGPIGAGLELDHLCRNRGCVRPDHLEPVPPRVNTLRGLGAGARNARKTKCSRGHELAGEHLYVDPAGGRHCRTCKRITEGVTR